MPEYRLYCLDGAGKITKAEEITARDDAEGLKIAKALKRHTKCELWNRDRLIAKIPPAPHGK
jgi:hypothetical protein